MQMVDRLAAIAAGVDDRAEAFRSPSLLAILAATRWRYPIKS